MTQHGERTKVLHVPVSELQIHPRAQRSIIKSRLAAMRAAFSLAKIGMLAAVNYAIRGKNGPWIVDGQHRVVILKELLPGNQLVKVQVHLDVTDDAGAAELFLGLNDAAPVSTFAKFLNAVIAKHPAAIGVTRILKEFELDVQPGKASGHICCVSALQKLYLHDDGKSLRRTLAVITRSWGTSADAMEGKVLEGMGIVVVKYDGKFDEGTLVRKLSKYPGGAANLLGAARGMLRYSRKPVAYCVAKVVLDLYNQGRSTGRMPELPPSISARPKRAPAIGAPSVVPGPAAPGPGPRP